MLFPVSAHCSLLPRPPRAQAVSPPKHTLAPCAQSPQRRLEHAGGRQWHHMNHHARQSPSCCWGVTASSLAVHPWEQEQVAPRCFALPQSSCSRLRTPSPGTGLSSLDCLECSLVYFRLGVFREKLLVLRLPERTAPSTGCIWLKVTYQYSSETAIKIQAQKRQFCLLLFWSFAHRRQGVPEVEYHTWLRLAPLLRAVLRISGGSLGDNCSRGRQEGTGLAVKTPLMFRRLEVWPPWRLQHVFPLSKRSVTSLI